MHKPFLSVVMLTYGHEKYIRQAIEGVFLQETNFDIELIIANDHSPDCTDEIVKSIILNSPHHINIKYIKHEKNIGMMANFIWTLKQAQGKYVAICEGDDYWIAPLKLQKQVDFLETNLDFSIHCHNFKTQDGDVINNASHFDFLNPKEEMTILDLSKNNIIPTLTSVFRNQELTFQEWSLQSPLGDIVLFMQVAKKGKIKYLNEKMAVYRQNVGIWSGKKMNQEKMVDLFENLAFDYKDLPAVQKNLLNHRNKHIKASLKGKSFSEMISNQNFTQLSTIEKAKLIIQKML